MMYPPMTGRTQPLHAERFRVIGVVGVRSLRTAPHAWFTGEPSRLESVSHRLMGSGPCGTVERDLLGIGPLLALGFRTSSGFGVRLSIAPIIGGDVRSAVSFPGSGVGEYPLVMLPLPPASP
jgi:hypothetical protein